MNLPGLREIGVCLSGDLLPQSFRSICRTRLLEPISKRPTIPLASPSGWMPFDHRLSHCRGRRITSKTTLAGQTRRHRDGQIDPEVDLHSTRTEQPRNQNELNLGLVAYREEGLPTELKLSSLILWSDHVEFQRIEAFNCPTILQRFNILIFRDDNGH